MQSSRSIANTVSRPRAAVHVTVDCISTTGYSRLMWTKRKLNEFNDPLPNDADIRAHIVNLRQICDKKHYGMVSIKLTEALDALQKKK